MKREQLNSKDVSTLVRAVQHAGQALVENRRGTGGVTKSSRFDFGIPQDLQSEHVLLDAVDSLDLNACVVAEESGVHGKPDAEYTIYIDPLDGSVNYARGIPAYAIALAVYRHKQPALGIIHDPTTSETFIAQRGQGVTINGIPLTPNTRPAGCCLLVNLEWFGASSYQDTSTRLHQAGIRARTAGSGVLALLYATLGRGDGAVLVENRPWDVAPGLVFAAELGHTVTTPTGQPVDLAQKTIDILAAPPAVHQQLLNALGHQAAT